MKDKEDKFKVTVHLIGGTKLDMFGGANRTQLLEIYRCLGADDSRIKFPTAVNVMQFLPASAILRIEAEGGWDA